MMWVQVVIDAESPHDLADWWAATLAWEVEPQDESFIRSMIEQGYATEADTVTHNGALVWATATAVRPPADATEETAGTTETRPASAHSRPRLLFQQVPEPKVSKNRLHLDLRPSPEADLAAVHADLLARGAREVGEGQQGPHRWVTYADPEGNEFCIDR
jgi:hypothetical protein